MDNRQGINSVEVAYTVMQAIEQAGRPLTLTEISHALSDQPSKVFRYLVSLTRVGLLTRDDDGRYDFGPAMRRMGAEATRRTNEIAVASQHTPRLRDRTGHSVNLSVWSDRGPTIVRWDFGAYALPIIPRTGSVISLLSTSSGQAFLAMLPETMTAALVEEELRGSGDLAQARRQVSEQRDLVRERGYSVMHGAIIRGLTTFSAGTLNSERQLPLVITIACAAGTLQSREDDEKVVRELLATTQAIAQDLGD